MSIASTAKRYWPILAAIALGIAISIPGDVLKPGDTKKEYSNVENSD